MTIKPGFGMGRVYLDASAEAQRRGDRRVSTEHILLAMLVDAESATARALGVDLTTARATLQRLDREALSAIGIEVSHDGPLITGHGEERLPLTPGAKAVFTSLRRTAQGEHIAVKHVLLGLLDAGRPEPVAELLDALGVHRANVRHHLRSA